MAVERPPTSPHHAQSILPVLICGLTLRGASRTEVQVVAPAHEGRATPVRVDIKALTLEHHDVRTTLTLDDDVTARLERLRRKRKASFKQIVNDAMRAGLDALEKPRPLKPFRTIRPSRTEPYRQPRTTSRRCSRASKATITSDPRRLRTHRDQFRRLSSAAEPRLPGAMCRSGSPAPWHGRLCRVNITARCSAT